MNDDSNRPFKSVYEQINMHASEFIKGTNFDEFDVMGVIIKESMGLPYWCACDALAHANLQVLEAHTGVKEDEFQKHYTVQNGIHKGEFPKFRFEPSWWVQAQQKFPITKMEKIDAIGFACSWGLGQKSALYKFAGLPPTQAINELKTFIGDPAAQIHQVATDLAVLTFDKKKPMELAFTQYNAGAGALRVSEYGTDVLRLSSLFRKCYT